MTAEERLRSYDAKIEAAKMDRLIDGIPVILDELISMRRLYKAVMELINRVHHGMPDCRLDKVIMSYINARIDGIEHQYAIKLAVLEC